MRGVICIVLVAVASATMIKTFLQQSRSALASANRRPVVLCLGNEAADADSIVSSLCYGFLKHAIQEESATSFVPVVSIPRSILKLRPETEILLQMADLELDDLICVEDVDVGSLSKKQQIDGLILTDHNVLSNKISSLFACESQHAPLVTEIVDHHIDSGAHAHVQGTSRNIAFDESTGSVTAASACTLVAEKLLDVRNSLDVDVKRALSKLLCGVILIDTQNMASTGAGTDRDAAVLNTLLQSPDLLNNTWDRDAVASQLRGAKTSAAFWSSLSAIQCLLIDYKEFPCGSSEEEEKAGIFGMSTVACRLADFCRKDHCYRDMAGYLHDPSMGGVEGQAALDILAVMASFIDEEKGYTRELLVASLDEGRLDSVTAYLTDTEPTMELASLTGIEAPPGLHVRAYSQGNVKASRKQLAPLLTRYYDSDSNVA